MRMWINKFLLNCDLMCTCTRTRNSLQNIKILLAVRLDTTNLAIQFRGTRPFDEVLQLMSSFSPDHVAVWRTGLVCLQMALPLAWRESLDREERRDLLVTSVFNTLRLTLEQCDSVAAREEALALVYLLLEHDSQRSRALARNASRTTLDRAPPLTQQPQAVHPHPQPHQETALCSAIDDFQLHVLLKDIALSSTGTLANLAAECLYSLVQCGPLLALMFRSACRRSDAAMARFILDVLRFDPSPAPTLTPTPTPTPREASAETSSCSCNDPKLKQHSSSSPLPAPLLFAIDEARSEGDACAVAKLLLELRVDPTHILDAFKLCVRKQYHTLASIVVAYSPFILGIQ